MSILFVDGMSDRLQNEGKYDNWPSNLHGWSASRHEGDKAVMEANNASSGADFRWGKIIPESFEVAAGVANRLTNQSGDNRRAYLQFRTAGGVLCSLRRTSGQNGTLQLRMGDGGTLIDEIYNVGVSAWLQASVRIVIDPVTPENGHYEWYIGDEYIGSDSHDFGADPIVEVALCSGSSTSSSTDRRMAFEDFWVTDGERLYDARIATIRPVGTGAVTDWSPSESGNNYELVNHESLDRSRFVHTDTHQDVDLYEFEAIPQDDVRDTVRAVVLLAVAAKTDPQDRSLELAVRASGGVNFYGEERDILGESVLYDQWDENPHTNAPWTKGQVDGSQFGFRALKPGG